MSHLREHNSITVQHSTSPLRFEKTGGGSWPEWDRFLMLENKPAFHLGNICNTCSYFFERKDGANAAVKPGPLGDALARGLTSLSDVHARTAGAMLPDGNFEAMLLETTLRRVRPNDPDDYFCKEQVALWGMDSFFDLPHSPRTEYYRATAPALELPAAFYEFVVPMFPRRWLKTPRLEELTQQMAAGTKPTAVAISVLDVKAPGTLEPKPGTVGEHWCLTHYLLDGHHKTYVASETGRPLSLLSFLAIDQGISEEPQWRKVLEVLAKAPPPVPRP